MDLVRTCGQTQLRLRQPRNKRTGLPTSSTRCSLPTFAIRLASRDPLPTLSRNLIGEHSLVHNMCGVLCECAGSGGPQMRRTADCIGSVISIEIIGSLRNVTLHSQLPRFGRYAPGRRSCKATDMVPRGREVGDSTSFGRGKACANPNL